MARDAAAVSAVWKSRGQDEAGGSFLRSAEGLEASGSVARVQQLDGGAAVADRGLVLRQQIEDGLAAQRGTGRRHPTRTRQQRRGDHSHP